MLVLEGLRGSETLNSAAVWPIAQAAVAAAALTVAWWWRSELRLPAILVIGGAFQLAWVLLHLKLGVAGDHDPLDVYTAQGNELRHGSYPRSEYPPGAVLLFGLETWLGGGHARTANALLMIPCQLTCVAALWSLRTQWTPWLAAFLAVWPLNAYYWEFRFDLLPTAALLVGLALSWRNRWGLAGAALGIGAIAKWTPGLAAIGLCLWLLRERSPRRARDFALGFSLPVLAANVPLLLLDRSDLVAAYTTQNGRVVTPESFVYLPLHLFWNADAGYWYFGSADISPQANRAAVWFQIAVVVVAIAAVVFARTHAAAVALAGLVPAVFLLTNRIFSPQFFVLVLAAVLVAVALIAVDAVEVGLITAACAVATTANTVLFQSMLGAQPVATFSHWIYVSALVYVPTLAAIAWLTVCATRRTGLVIEPAAAAL